MFKLSANDVLVSQKVPMENERSISLGGTVLELENATLSALLESLFSTGLLYSIV